ncbi:type VII secretion protein EccB [Streptomyces fructofermentans]|uniref:type VII secretion protein EccB n=1 Tax=Streptomyces fructofermentans TaxID=152141 RepID=UPI0033C12C33
MQTRRDHVQAYQFAAGRLASALVSGEPGRGESPTRRSALGTVFGVALVVLLCAGFGVYGLVSPIAKDDWRKDGVLVLDKDTGNRYIYARGVLRPTRNYASALLITGKRNAPQTPSAKSLAGVPHGAPVGIPGAPDSVPDASSLATGSWAQCLPSPGTTTGPSLLFGSAASTLRPLTASRQIMVSGPKGAQYLIWRNVKYPVPDPTTRIALGMDGQKTFSARTEWLASVPTGAPLAVPPPPNAGKAASKVAGKASRVGQLFRTSTAGTERHYLLRAEGLVPVSPTAYALLAARPGAAQPRQVEQSDIAVAPVSTARATTDRIPDVLGVPALDGKTACLEQLPNGRHKLTVGPPNSRRVVLPPGGGVLAVPHGTRTPYLITEQGMKYRLASDDAVQALGLGGTRNRLTLPADVLNLIPDGPELSRAAAARG